MRFGSISDSSAVSLARLTVLLAVLAVAGTVVGQETAIEKDRNDNVIVTAEDLILRDPQGVQADVSVRSLLAEVASLKALLSLPDELASLKDRVQTLESADPDDPTQATLDAIEDSARGILSQTQKARTALGEDLDTKLVTQGSRLREEVGTLSESVTYLLSHVENSTTCSTDSSVHIGDGQCAPIVPRCPAPAQPDNGVVTLSNPTYIIPGTVATYECPDPQHFVEGPAIRTCGEDKAFFPAMVPVCSVCQVSNCLQCEGSDTTCVKCNTGHDLSIDKTTCTARQEALIIFGGSPPGSGHNWRESAILYPNSQTFQNYLPYAPVSFNLGAGGIIGNAIAGLRNNGDLYTKEFGASFWVRQVDHKFPFSCGSGFCQRAFFAAVNGVSNSVDGLYVFALSGSAVLRRNVNGEYAWTVLPTLGDGAQDVLRREGSTAYADGKIYIIGGKTRANKVTARVDIFDLQSQQFSRGVDLPEPRSLHAAATFNGKLFVFGGKPSSTNQRDPAAMMLGPGDNSWTQVTPMPHAWADFTTGPLPVYPNGDVVIAGAHQTGGTAGEHVYLLYKSTTDEWTTMATPTSTRNRFGGKYVAMLGVVEGQ